MVFIVYLIWRKLGDAIGRFNVTKSSLRIARIRETDGALRVKGESFGEIDGVERAYFTS